jgi:hypothetical protein
VEEGFLTGMVRALQDYRGKAKVSPKQWDNVRRILQKLELEPTEQGIEDEEECEPHFAKKLREGCASPKPQRSLLATAGQLDGVSLSASGQRL